MYTILMPKSTIKPKKIYMDYASSALSASANPSAIHDLGVKERSKLEDARSKVAKILNANSNEIIFTSGATESNNLAILGLLQRMNFFSVARSLASLSHSFKKVHSLPHIVTTNIEHASVLEVCKYLEKTKQAKVTYVPVGTNGIVDPRAIKKALGPNTILVSVMYANNEIGTVQPIRDIAKEIRHFNKVNPKQNHKIFFHTDAVQAINYLSINVAQLGVDLMTFNSAKIYGPKGAGVLYVKRQVPIRGIMFGGNQEGGLRPGTENVASILGLAQALTKTEKIKNEEVKRLTKLRDYFFNQLSHSNILTNIRITINGDLKNRLPNNINITIPKIPSDLLVIELSAYGIMASAKSACKSGDGKTSHVIEAINPKTQDTDGSLRFSLGRDTDKKDIDYTIQALKEILTKLKKWYN